MIEGLGLYEVEIEFERNITKDLMSEIKAKIHDDPTLKLIEFKNRHSARFVAERTEVYKKGKALTEDWYGTNSIGGILIQFDLPKAGLIKKINVRSMQTGKSINIIENWPFDIEKPTNNQIKLNPNINYVSDLSKSNKNGFSIFNPRALTKAQNEANP